MSTPEQIHTWVNEFADSIIRQTEAIRQGDHRTGNQNAKRYITAFNKLRTLGDRGRDALVPLMNHPRDDVKTTAAAFLLRYRTEAALRVLRSVAAGQGLAAFEASQAIKRWEEKDWHLDPED